MKYLSLLLLVACSASADTRGQIAGDQARTPAEEYKAFYADNPPLLLATVPVEGGALSSLNPVVYLSFSEPLDPASVNSITISIARDDAPGVLLDAAYALQSSSVLVSANMAPGAHTLTLTTDILDTSGTALAQATALHFTVVFASLTDEQRNAGPPVVVSSRPADMATVFTRTPTLVFEFSEPVSATLDDLTLHGASQVDGTISAVGSLLFFQPLAPLEAGAAYTLKADTDVRDASGVSLASDAIVHFTVDGVPPLGPMLTATATLGAIDLEWSASGAADLARYALVRRSDRAPANVEDGEVIYSGMALSFSDQSARLAPRYFYAAFAIDTADNTSVPGLAEVDAVYAIRLAVTSPATAQPLGTLACEIFDASDTSYTVARYQLTHAVPAGLEAQHVFTQLVPFGQYQAFCFRDAGDLHPQHNDSSTLQSAERVSPILQIQSPCATQNCSIAVLVDQTFNQNVSFNSTRAVGQLHTRHDPYMIQDDCGGYVLYFAANHDRTLVDCSMIVAKAQAGAPTHAMKDDGQCDLARFGEETTGSGSHDRRAGDGLWTVAIRNPTPADAGDYLHRVLCDVSGGRIVARHPETIEQIVDLPPPLFSGPFVGSSPSFLCNLAVPYLSAPTGPCAPTGQFTRLTVAAPPAVSGATVGRFLESMVFPYTVMLDRTTTTNTNNYGALSPVESNMSDPTFAAGFYLRQVDGIPLLAAGRDSVTRWVLFSEYEARSLSGELLARSAWAPLVYGSYASPDVAQVARITGTVSRQACATRPLLGYYVTLNAYPSLREEGVWLINSGWASEFHERAHAATFVQARGLGDATPIAFDMMLHTQGNATLELYATAWPVYDDGRGYPVDDLSFYNAAGLLSSVVVSANASTALPQNLELIEDCP